MSTAAKYVDGSVFGHLSTLAMTSAVGLFAIMVVDLVDMYFISLLGQPSLAAAVGFAGIGLFLGASVCIGVSIAVTTVVSRALGEVSAATGAEQDEQDADLKDDAAHTEEDPLLHVRQLATHGLIYSLLWTIPITILTLTFAPQILGAIGATGEVLTLALQYFRIVGASLPVLGLAFVANGLLRALGEARLSMWTTLWGGIVNGILDPILIFGAGLELRGAAIASVFSRLTVAAIGLYSILKTQEFIVKPAPQNMVRDFAEMTQVALASIVTNLSAPLSSAFATAQMAKFGTDAVAAASVIGRITPVLFAGLYGLSGAVGPIASQNFGAGKLDRVRGTLLAGARFVLIYVVPAILLMYFAHETLADIFSLGPDARELLDFYASFVVVSYLLFGLQLSANPLFTSMGHPGYATISNLARDLLLAIPMIALFSSLLGAKGVLAGQALANAIAGVLAFTFAYALSKRLESGKDFSFKWSVRQLHHHLHVIPGIQHRGH